MSVLLFMGERASASEYLQNFVCVLPRVPDTDDVLAMCQSAMTGAARARFSSGSMDWVAVLDVSDPRAVRKLLWNVRHERARENLEFYGFSSPWQCDNRRWHALEQLEEVPVLEKDWTLSVNGAWTAAGVRVPGKGDVAHIPVTDLVT